MTKLTLTDLKMHMKKLCPRFKAGKLKRCHLSFPATPIEMVTGQNGIGQNGTDKMVATFTDSNLT